MFQAGIVIFEHLCLGCFLLLLLGKEQSVDGAPEEEGPSGSAIRWGLYEERWYVSPISPCFHGLPVTDLTFHWKGFHHCFNGRLDFSHHWDQNCFIRTFPRSCKYFKLFGFWICYLQNTFFFYMGSTLQNMMLILTRLSEVSSDVALPVMVIICVFFYKPWFLCLTVMSQMLWRT